MALSRFFRTFVPDMKEVTIQDAVLRKAASEGMDAFVACFVHAIKEEIGGELTAETLGELNSDQITLLAWQTLHDEVMDGGFVQLIHNGYGAFIFRNPTAKALKGWGLDDLAKLIKKCYKLYMEYHEEIERDCSDDEFMALFERFSKFDDFDDDFVENEEEWTSMVAYYVDEHLDEFVEVKSQVF